MGTDFSVRLVLCPRVACEDLSLGLGRNVGRRTCNLRRIALAEAVWACRYCVTLVPLGEVFAVGILMVLCVWFLWSRGCSGVIYSGFSGTRIAVFFTVVLFSFVASFHLRVSSTVYFYVPDNKVKVAAFLGSSSFGLNVLTPLAGSRV